MVWCKNNYGESEINILLITSIKEWLAFVIKTSHFSNQWFTLFLNIFLFAITFFLLFYSNNTILND